MGIAERVEQVVRPILDDLGCELYDLEAGGSLVRVTVDRDGGVDLDTLALITRLVSRELDEHDPLPGAYTLEVTSPGLERSLRRPEHFRRALGRTVAIRTHPGVPGDRRLEGVLVAADDDGVTVRPDDLTLPERRLAFTEVERARTTFLWGGQPKPGQPKPGRATSGQAKAGPSKPGPGTARPARPTRTAPEPLPPHESRSES